MIYFEIRAQFPNGKFYTRLWQGKDGLDACHKYADSHPGHIVWAWRHVERVGFFPYGLPRNASF